MAARHSISYNKLPDWFLAFDIMEKATGRFVSRCAVRPLGLGAFGCSNFYWTQSNMIYQAIHSRGSTESAIGAHSLQRTLKLSNVSLKIELSECLSTMFDNTILERKHACSLHV